MQYCFVLRHFRVPKHVSFLKFKPKVFLKLWLARQNALRLSFQFSFRQYLRQFGIVIYLYFTSIKCFEKKNYQIKTYFLMPNNCQDMQLHKRQPESAYPTHTKSLCLNKHRLLQITKLTETRNRLYKTTCIPHIKNHHV